MVAIYKKEFNHPFVGVAENEEDAIKYLQQTYNNSIGGWWYSYEDGFIIKPIEIFKPNPNDDRVFHKL